MMVLLLQQIAFKGMLLVISGMLLSAVTDVPWMELGVTGGAGGAGFTAYRLIARAQEKSYILRLETHDEIVALLNAQIDSLERQLERSEDRANKMSDELLEQAEYIRKHIRGGE